MPFWTRESFKHQVWSHTSTEPAKHRQVSGYSGLLLGQKRWKADPNSFAKSINTILQIFEVCLFLRQEVLLSREFNSINQSLSVSPSEIDRSSHWPWNYTISVGNIHLKKKRINLKKLSKGHAVFGFCHSPLPSSEIVDVSLPYKIPISLFPKHTALAQFFPPAVLFLISEELCLLHTSLNEKRIRHSIFTAFVSKINDCVLLLSPWLIPGICCQFRLAQCQDLTHSKNIRKIATLHLIGSLEVLCTQSCSSWEGSRPTAFLDTCFYLSTLQKFTLWVLDRKQMTREA